MRWLAAVAVCLSLTDPKSAIVTAQEIPLVGQPTANFYGAAGKGVKAAWRLDRPGNPAEIPEDGEFVATLAVTGVTNPGKVTRPDLKKLPEFQDRFLIADAPDPAAAPKELTFSYRLRPRNRDVRALPEFEFRYFDKDAAEGKQFKPAVAREVPLVVIAAAPKPAEAAVPLQEPDQLFAVVNGPGVLGSPGFVPGERAWVALAVAAPLAALGWYLAWRQLFPDGHRLARLRRSRAARRAADAIGRAGRAADPPAALAAAVLGYLRARFPLPPGAVTAAEVGAALAELGVPSESAAGVAAFLRECDAARFSPSGDNGMSLTSDAAALVARLEAA